MPLSKNQYRQGKKTIARHGGIEIGGGWHHENQTAKSTQRPGKDHSGVLHLIDIDAHGIRCLGMLPAGPQAQTETCVVNHNHGNHQNGQTNICGDIGVFKE